MQYRTSETIKTEQTPVRLTQLRLQPPSMWKTHSDWPPLGKTRPHSSLWLVKGNVSLTSGNVRSLSSVSATELSESQTNTPAFHGAGALGKMKLINGGRAASRPGMKKKRGKKQQPAAVDAFHEWDYFYDHFLDGFLNSRLCFETKWARSPEEAHQDSTSRNSQER